MATLPITIFMFSIDVIEVLVNANEINIPICVICFKIRSNPDVGRITRMHCVYQNLDNIDYLLALFFFFNPSSFRLYFECRINKNALFQTDFFGDFAHCMLSLSETLKGPRKCSNGPTYRTSHLSNGPTYWKSHLSVILVIESILYKLWLFIFVF